MNFRGSIKVRGLRLLASGATVALAAIWLWQSSVDQPWGARLLAAGGTLIGIIALARWEQRMRTGDERAARLFLERLCRLDLQELANPQATDGLPRLADDHAWLPVLTRVRERLVEYGRRADESEHAWTSCEVRLRRIENHNFRSREILDRIPEPVVAVNAYDEVTWANEPARVLFGIGTMPETPLKLEVAVACPPLVRRLTETRRRKTETQRVGELEIVDPSGQARWFRAVCRTLPEHAGESSGQRGAMAVLTDISHEKGIQKRHAEFVAAAAHEMKTPLSSIRAYVELLQDGEVEDAGTQEEFWTVIQTQAERLQRLIDNLLNLARIEAGVVRVEKQTLSLKEVLEQACGVVQPSAEQKAIRVGRDFSPMYLGVLADRDMILQAAINLLSNAVKYTPSGGEVVVRSRIDDSAALFEVHDTGVGLSVEDCEKVFDKFYRVKRDEQMAPGTGLGLPLAKHIVEDVHGGSLTVASELGAGSVFRVTLPVAGGTRILGEETS
jgi:two-component system phosphate regulon sensor histidine kinase PhoR